MLEQATYLQAFYLIIATLLVIILSMFFALIESAIFFIDDIKLNRIIHKKPKNIEMIVRIIERKDEHMSAMVFIITLVSIFGSAIIGALSAKIFDNLVLTIFTLILTYLILTFGKIIPKIIAVDYCDEIIIKTARIIRIITIISKPIVFFSLIWLKVFSNKSRNGLTLEDLKQIINFYSKKGVLHIAEQEMVKKIFEINKKSINDLINWKNQPGFLNANSKISDNKDIIVLSKNKRFLVTNNSEIVGVAFEREISKALLQKPDDSISTYTKKCSFVQDSDLVTDVLNKFKEERTIIAVVQNEQGDFIDVITAKQVYSEILKEH